MITGWWRFSLLPFQLSPRRMTVARLGLKVTVAAHVERVNTILRSFIGGFNTMISPRSYQACQGHCDSLPSLYQPFAHEGLAMGYILRNGFRYRADVFEEQIVKPRPEFRYLYYVGLGFWSGMRNYHPHRLQRMVDGLDPLHRYLCYDGYAFTRAFFHYPRRGASALDRLSGFEGYARHAAYQGVGRAFYFLFMDEPQTLIERIGELGDYARDAAAGVGLAAAFVNPDRLEVALDLARKMPHTSQPHIHLGLCFGLKARAINDVDRFEKDMSRLPSDVQNAVFASIRECDRVELLIRSETGDDGYCQWRERVSDWMNDHIVYPLEGMKKESGIKNVPEPRVLARAETNFNLSRRRN